MAELDHTSYEVVEIPSLCPICYCNAPSVSLAGCLHQFCAMCLRSHIEISINSGLSRTLTCPQSGCPTEIDPAKFTASLDLNDELISRYHTIIRNREIASDPDKKFCPYPSCEGIIPRPSIPTLTSVNQQISKVVSATCNQCHKQVCFKCGNPWHPQIDCDRAIDPRFRDFVKMNPTKTCPHCGLVTLRFEGCMHMKCTSCNKDWCWRCGLAYNEKRLHLCPELSWLKASRSKRICIEWCLFLMELFKILFILPTILTIFLIQSVCQHVRTFMHFPLYPFTHHTFIYFDINEFQRHPPTKQRRILVLWFLLLVLALYPIYLLIMVSKLLFLLVGKEVLGNMGSLIFCCKLSDATRTRMSM